MRELVETRRIASSLFLPVAFLLFFSFFSLSTRVLSYLFSTYLSMSAHFSVAD